MKELHCPHYIRVERTLYLVRKIDPDITKEAVKRIVKLCTRCQSIDPSPNTHVPGEIQVTTEWTRLAIEVTHYRGKLYLTMVDCCPGRIAIWKEIRSEAAIIVAEVPMRSF